MNKNENVSISMLRKITLFKRVDSYSFLQTTNSRSQFKQCHHSHSTKQNPQTQQNKRKQVSIIHQKQKATIEKQLVHLFNNAF